MSMFLIIKQVFYKINSLLTDLIKFIHHHLVTMVFASVKKRGKKTRSLTLSKNQNGNRKLYHITLENGFRIKKKLFLQI